MANINKRWLVNRTNREFLEFLSEKTSLSTALAQIFVNRGMKDAEAIKDFLSPSLKNLHDPFLMPDMEKAVERIRYAKENGDAILVYGDYDADGITSTALMFSALQRLGLKADYYIPNRLVDGYGFSKEGVKKAEALGVRLIITVDCGISSIEEVSMAVSRGIDVIITDHHEPPKKLPDATAVINPHRKDSEYPFKHLAGVGVVYKFVQAIFQDSGAEDFLDLVAIGTIADSVPLVGENRILTAYGLRALNSDPVPAGTNASIKPWIPALKETSGIGSKEIRSGMLSYTIIPRINAVGRLGDANKVVEFFLTQDMARAKEIASRLEKNNRERQRIESDVFKSALDMIDTDHLDSAIVLGSSAWHPGVIGIVASRLVEMFYRPTFLFSVKDAVAKGSARSIPSFHIYKGITDCSEFLLDYGGHNQAAGLRLYAGNLEAFKNKINAVVKNTLSFQDMIPTVGIDAEVNLFEVNFDLIKELNLLEPFGNSNPKPILGAKGVEVADSRGVGNNHLKMKLKQKSVNIDTIGFRMGNLLEEIAGLYTIDVAFVPCINEWNGNKTLQLNLKAIRPSI